MQSGAIVYHLAVAVANIIICMMTGAIAFELPNTKICTQHVQYILLQPHELSSTNSI